MNTLGVTRDPPPVANGRARAIRVACGVLVLVCSTLSTIPALAQFATLRGRVTDAEDGQPLQGVHIALRGEDGSLTGTATNAGGFYVIGRVRPGTYQSEISFIGYKAQVDTLVFDFLQQMTLNAELEPDAEVMGEVVVEEESDRGNMTGNAGAATIRPSELARITAPGLSPDLVTYLLSTPGFVSTGDRGGQLFVRGGTPVQNLFLVDGLTVYQPLHIVGFYSAFPADIISSADIYAGGFGARYGGRVSSVVDVTTTNGNKRQLSGSASLAPFLGAIHLELPVARDRVSVVLSARESVIERIAPTVLGEELPYRFNDQFFKLHGFVSSAGHVAITGLRTFDTGRVAGDTGLGRKISWRNEAYGGRYFYLAPTFPVLAELSVGISRFEIWNGEREDPERVGTVDGFTAGINFGYLLGNYELHFGIFGQSTRYAFDLQPSLFSEVEEYVAEGGIFMYHRIRIADQIQIEPGVRLHTFPSRGQSYAEPRFRATYEPGGRLRRHRMSLAFGRYHQQITGLSNDQTVTDVFTAWTPVPESQRIPQSTHLIVGVKSRVYSWLATRVEVYGKTLDNVSFPELGQPLTNNTRFLNLEGSVVGADFHADALGRQWNATVTYGLSSVWYRNDDLRFRPPNDRRHYINADASVRRRLYSLSLRWQIGSGLPFTRIMGFYDRPAADSPNPASLLESGAAAVGYDEPYRGRLPVYHRLDVTLNRRFEFDNASATLQIGAVNAYDRANLFDYDPFTATRVNQLPIIPTVGLKVAIR